ncbi:MAG: branched-chain amino acid ABC transporter permease [Desulfobacteraceae bacterium]|nr:MAG: branched-chain amino acid ABC transporter permease [Desulfobacteraceae bacterium]
MQTEKSFFITLACVLVAFAAGPLVVSDVHFHHLMIMMLLYTTLSQAWNLIGGYAGQVSFGHAVFFGIGAYAAMAPLNQWGITPWVGMTFGAVIAVLVAVIVGVPVFRLKGHYFAISTFAVAEVVRELFSNWEWVDGPIGLDAPILEEGFYNFMWYQTKIPYHYITLVFFILMMLVTFRMERSRMGYYFRAIKQRPEAARAMGVNIVLYKQYALVISAFFTAICGAFYGMYVLHIEPGTVLSLDISIKIVLITALGGAGSLWGPLLGAAILIPLQEYSRIWLGGTGKGIDLIVLGTLIVIICIFEPRGIVGVIKRFTQRKRNVDGYSGIEEPQHAFRRTGGS